MSDDRELVELLAAIDATPRASWVAGLRADLDAAWEIEDAGYLDLLRTTTVAVVDHEPIPPTSGHRWSILAAAAAAVLLVGVLVVYDGDGVTPADEPSPTLTVAPTVPPTWSPELTAQVLSPAISCDISTELGDRHTEHGCPSVAVSPDGTLVAFDRVARTLTWYEDEPRVVSLTAEGPLFLMEIGPHDVAYFHTSRNWIVAVAPSGAEISRTPVGSNAGLYPTASGLVPFRGGGSSHQCLSASAAPPIPWVDPDGNPITDTRPYPTATATDAGIEIRLGERKWLLADEEAGRTPGRLECFDFRPRSDGGVVIVVDDGPGPNRDRTNVFELLPDGTIDRYFVEGGAKVLPDGSMIVEHDLQLIRLTPPA